MSEFHRIHTALFDELARQGAMHVDIGRLTRAVVRATHAVSAQSSDAPAELRVHPENPRCANGACE